MHDLISDVNIIIVLEPLYAICHIMQTLYQRSLLHHFVFY